MTHSEYRVSRERQEVTDRELKCTDREEDNLEQWPSDSF